MSAVGLAVRGWIGPGERRLAVEIEPGQVVESPVPDPAGLLRRAAGVHGPRLWVRLDGRELTGAAPDARARAGLAVVDGQMPRSDDLTVLDLVLAGRALPGPLGFLGGGGRTRRELAERRETEARALAGRLGLGPSLEEPCAALEPRAAVIVDVARALLGEPRGLVAVLPADPEAAGWLRARLTEEAAARAVSILLLRTAEDG